METKIRKILDELYEIEPALRSRESELRNIIAELLLSKPDTRFDETFARKLRFELVEKAEHSKRRSWQELFRYWGIGSTIGVAIAIVLIFTATKNSMPGMMVESVSVKDKGAFGSLLSEGQSAGDASAAFLADGKQADSADAGKRSGETASIAPFSGPEGAVPAGMAYGGDASVQSRMIAPSGGMRYAFSYEGETVKLAAEGKVYKRLKNATATNDLISILHGMNLDFVSIGNFKDLRVDNLSVSENRPQGYTVSFDFNEGMAYIGADYRTWNNGRDIAPARSDDIKMTEDELVRIASGFLAEKGISTDGYGEPLIQLAGDVRIMEAQSSRTTMLYPAAYATVVYPILVEGQKTYEEGGASYGLLVSIDGNARRVTGVSNLINRRFESSAYDLETDWNQILEALKRREFYSYGGGQKATSIKLGTPEKVLMRYFLWKENGSEELLVPALAFPIQSIPDGVYYYAAHVVIPLPKELLKQNQSSGPIMPLEKR